jgi:bifunctional non-homologous end joining protein LigD
MRLLRIPEPFDHPDFMFEPKIDGFRALAHVAGHRGQLVSRNGHVFKSWPQLAEEIAHAIRANHGVIDGEICCLDRDGRSNFNNLLFRREWPHFYAFDVLSIDGKDLRALPLNERKLRLRAIMPNIESRLLYLDHVAERRLRFVPRRVRT